MSNSCRRGPVERDSLAGVLGITHYTVPAGDTATFRDSVLVALEAFASCPGYVDGHVARSIDDTTLWTMTVRFDSAGSYRRALSSYRVKAEAVPVMYLAQERPSAFEPLASHDGTAMQTFNSDVNAMPERGRR